MILAKVIKKIGRSAKAIADPKLISLLRRDIPVNIYLKLNQPWLTDAGIKTVIDIGANVGQFAKLIHEVLPYAMIYSFEPLEDCYEELNQNMRKVKNFRAFNVAIGNMDGELEFHRSEFSPSSSVLPMTCLHKQNYPFTARNSIIKVKSVRLDYIARELNIIPNLLVKIDVQGFEDKVISGGWLTIRRAKILVLETSFQQLYVGQPLFEDIYESLKMDFQYIGSLGSPRVNRTDGSPLFEDSIFINRTINGIS
jgi:FkbM family methyltransferase